VVLHLGGHCPWEQEVVNAQKLVPPPPVAGAHAINTGLEHLVSTVGWQMIASYGSGLPEANGIPPTRIAEFITSIAF